MSILLGIESNKEQTRCRGDSNVAAFKVCKHHKINTEGKTIDFFKVLPWILQLLSFTILADRKW